MKKVITVFMLMLMVVSLAACGAKESAVEEQTDISTTDVVEGVAENVEEAVETVEEDTRTVVWTYEDRDALLEAFRSNGTKLDHSDEYFDYYVKSTFVGDAKDSLVNTVFFNYGNAEEGSIPFSNMSQVQLEFASLGNHALSIDKKTVNSKEITTITVRNSKDEMPITYELDSEGHIKSKPSDIKWLADEAAVNEFITTANSYLAYTGLTLDDIIDFNAFVKAVNE